MIYKTRISSQQTQVSGVGTEPKLTGTRLADGHVSVKRSRPYPKVYKKVRQAIQNDPFRPDINKKAARMWAVADILDRTQHLAQRFNENYQVSRADHVRMEKEFGYLKERMLKLASDDLYRQPIELWDQGGEAARGLIAPNQLALRLGQLMDAVFEGAYAAKGEASNQVRSAAVDVRLSRYFGEGQEDFSLALAGPAHLFHQNTPRVHSVMDLTDDLDRLRERAGEDNAERWVQQSADLTAQKILDNPSRAINAQVDGFEKSGLILLRAP